MIKMCACGKRKCLRRGGVFQSACWECLPAIPPCTCGQPVMVDKNGKSLGRCRACMSVCLSAGHALRAQAITRRHNAKIDAQLKRELEETVRVKARREYARFKLRELREQPIAPVRQWRIQPPRRNYDGTAVQDHGCAVARMVEVGE